MSPLPTTWALDLDGTLVGPDHRLHPRTVEVLSAAHARGVMVVIATGRVLAATHRVLADLPFRPWLICCGGQTVLAPGEAPTVTSFVAPAHVADVLARAVPHADVAVQVYTADRQWMWRENAAGRFLADTEDLTFEPLADLAEVPADLVKIVLTASPDVARALDASFIGPLPYAYTPTGGRYRDVLPLGVDKGVALGRLLARTGGDPARVLAAGDNANDLPLLRAASVRVAVRGRSDALVALATHVVDTHEGGAVAEVLATFLPG